MKFLENWKRKRIVTRIVKRLPFQLARRYGDDRYYTAAQIEKTLNDENYRNVYRGYAFVLAMNPSSAAAHLGSDEVVTQMREELAAEFFHGNTGFDASAAKLASVGITDQLNGSGEGSGGLGGFDGGGSGGDGGGGGDG